jgi:hypothetical protein
MDAVVASINGLPITVPGMPLRDRARDEPSSPHLDLAILKETFVNTAG